jgi:hypothetical protein
MRENQQIERLNIPVSNSLLHNQEHNNTLNLVRFHSEKRRATSEKNRTKDYDESRMRSYHTEHAKQ